METSTNNDSTFKFDFAGYYSRQVEAQHFVRYAGHDCDRVWMEGIGAYSSEAAAKKAAEVSAMAGDGESYWYADRKEAEEYCNLADREVPTLTEYNLARVRPGDMFFDAPDPRGKNPHKQDPIYTVYKVNKKQHIIEYYYTIPHPTKSGEVIFKKSSWDFFTFFMRIENRGLIRMGTKRKESLQWLSDLCAGDSIEITDYDNELFKYGRKVTIKEVHPDKIIVTFGNYKNDPIDRELTPRYILARYEDGQLIYERKKSGTAIDLLFE